MCHISREKSGTTPGGMKTLDLWSLFNRSGLPQKLVQLSINVILRASLRQPAIEWQQSAMNLIAPVSRERVRAYYSVWHRIFKFTHLFNIIFSDLQLTNSNIISTDVENNLTEFTFSISQALLNLPRCQALWLPVNNGLWWLVSLFLCSVQ